METLIGEAVRTTCGDTQMIAEYNLYNKEGGGESNSAVASCGNIISYYFYFCPLPGGLKVQTKVKVGVYLILP
jgi:hypothetical protein